MAIQLIDGNGNSDQLTIKTGSAPAVSGDKAAVFTVHPNTVPMPISINSTLTVSNSSVTILNASLVAVPTDDIVTSGNFTSNAQILGPYPVSFGFPTAGIQIAGTWAGTIVIERSIDGSNWETAEASSGSDVVSSITANGIFVFPVGAAQDIRFRTTSWISGTATAVIARSAALQTIRFAAPLPSGTNSIGSVTANAGIGTFTVSNSSVTVLNSSVTVNGTFWQTTQNINGSVTVGNNLSVTILNTTNTVSINNFPTNQSVSVSNNISVTILNQSLTVSNSSVTILNQSITVGINNFPSIQTVNGSVTVGNNLSVTILNSSLNISNNSVTVLNFPASQTINGSVTANAGIGTFTVSNSSVTVLNPTLAVSSPSSTTSNNSSVAASASSVTLLASNSSRKGASIYNDSASATLYILYGATASATAYRTQLMPGGRHTVESNYTGVIAGIWSAAVGNARINEDV